ncbi:MAG: MBL fold metallo-hydrolase [Candidatus Aramenus sulfurataquae]|uniref:Hydrolase n=2 Tax=Candidatus Aramenus sulfurataquae TaxID=1326980 RepID=A0A0F2LPT1_9CREN|nr:MBL fold metallo-hydrolase [Candidatus Aramenus sulfurataquae]
MIKYFGHSMFSIDDKIVIDPHDGGSIGLERPEISHSDIVLVTHDHYDHNAYEILTYKDLKVMFTGTITYGDYKITGYKWYHDKERGKRRGETAIYKIETKDFTVVHLGDIGEIPREDILKEISSPDVLMIPVGGLITIDYKEAISLVNALKPRIVIPMHYWVKGHLMPLDPLEYFLKEYKGEVKEVNKKYIEGNEKGVIIFRV